MMAFTDRLRDANRRAEHAIATLRRLPHREYLQTEHWFRVRVLALERAHHTCALCPATTTLQVHHKNYQRKGFEQPEDLVVLSDSCHSRHHRVLALNQVRATEREPVYAPMVPASSIRWLKNA